MKKAFEELISRLHTAEEKTSELEDLSIKTSKHEKQIEKRLKEKRHRMEYPRTVGQLEKV